MGAWKMSGVALSPTSFLKGDAQVFRENFDRVPYTFEHTLSDHPLFRPTRLLELAKAMARNPGDVYFDAGEVSVGQRWDAVPPSDLPIDRLLERIETAGAWIVLRRAEKFPEYAAILDRCIAEIETLSGRKIDKLMRLKNAIIFVNSPGRVTSYHIDRECNWLLQIAGEKTLHVFDKNDRTILPEEEIERFWSIDNNAAIYKPQHAHRARKIRLLPGHGVHIPVGSPHWVQNGNQVAVSVSVNFHYTESLRANIYRANYMLRQLGLRPTPPGRSALRDTVKRAVVGPAVALRRRLKRLPMG
jgi:hypothetical protein